jgi:hypothetical protein
MKPSQTVKIDLTLELPVSTLERLTQQCYRGDVSESVARGGDLGTLTPIHPSSSNWVAKNVKQPNPMPSSVGFLLWFLSRVGRQSKPDSKLEGQKSLGAFKHVCGL